MKKFISRASRTFTNLPQLPPLANLNLGGTGIHQSSPTSNTNPSGIQPKFLIPPVPHPSPHTYLSVLVTDDGLLMRPHVPGDARGSSSYIRIRWQKNVKVEELQMNVDQEDIDWAGAAVVYGIVGVLELFNTSYLLVITNRTEVGTLFEPTHQVFNVKSVIAIPLELERARTVVNTLASRNEVLARPSLLSGVTLDTLPPSSPEGESVESPVSAARVHFASVDQVKVMTPNLEHSFQIDSLAPPRPHSPAPSESSSIATSDYSNEATSPVQPIAKALANKLSFWSSRLSKRGALFPSTPELTTSFDKDKEEELDRMVREEQGVPAEVLDGLLETTAPAPATSEAKHNEMEDRIIKECIREFTKGGMYFAYNFDITRSLQHKQDQTAKSQKQTALLADLIPSRQSMAFEGETVNALDEPFPTLPLWRRVDRQFWWNEALSRPFIDAGLHPYVLPIMQGYYQISHFLIPPEDNGDGETPVDYIVVSRRSRDRAGLRYQRRGVDEEARVANFVETETIMRIKREGITNIFAYVQIRGSIPLFWTQTGYGLKPPPVLDTGRTREQNLNAIRRHFDKTVPQYGPHNIVNLAEQHGKEGAVTTAYREYVNEMKNKDVVYHEYDFHSETKGMKYENISKLISAMEKIFEQQGYLWISNNTILYQQKGVFRVNCIDCLDRTNVVQSAFARYIMNKQLGAIALHNPSEDGPTETDMVFNDVWANNGDAISRAYAGTSALKGDFTRTGKRDLTGMLNDGVNSLARMYSSTFSDWFCQAVIDFMLGNRTLTVFSEFLLKLQSTDPRDLIRLSKIRAEAIATSVERVLSEGERLLGGWTLFSPQELNTKAVDKFEEKILLLTATAIYIISYDYSLEKVKIYTRVPLGDIIGITKGAYIISPLEEASCDPLENAGFMISWRNKDQVTRVSSYSVRNKVDALSPTSPSFKLQSPPSRSLSFEMQGKKIAASISRAASANATILSNILHNATMTMNGSEETFAAFKALPIDPARIRRASSMGHGDTYTSANDLDEASSCKEAVDMIVDNIRKACEDMGNSHDGLVKEGDVVSLAEAQQMTSMYAKMEYGVKRLLWLGG